MYLYIQRMVGAFILCGVWDNNILLLYPSSFLVPSHIFHCYLFFSSSSTHHHKERGVESRATGILIYYRLFFIWAFFMIIVAVLLFLSQFSSLSLSMSFSLSWYHNTISPLTPPSLPSSSSSTHLITPTNQPTNPSSPLIHQSNGQGSFTSYIPLVVSRYCHKNISYVTIVTSPCFLPCFILVVLDMINVTIFCSPSLSAPKSVFLSQFPLYVLSTVYCLLLKSCHVLWKDPQCPVLDIS